jgi:hypothetical protein
MFLFRRTIEKFFHEQVLREEASAILGRDPGDANSENPPKFYRNLNEFGFTALCLSGGGIRSAAFSLGVIQALAAHPRAPTGDTVGRAEDSLLSEFHYLSTVSGGGYIGSWLSAWRARDSFANVWRNLVDRPAGFDIEPSPISWLRSYSSYLTPKLGFLSADSWAIVAIYIQNLLLNWLIILSFLAGLILGVKLIAVVLVAATLEPTETTETWYKWYLPLFFGASGIVLLVMALKFVAGRRPSRQMHDTPLDLTETDHNPGDFSETVPYRVHPDHVKRMNDDQRVFLLRRLMPSLFSALFLTQCLSSDVIGHAFQQTHDGPFSALCDLSSDMTELVFLQTEKGVINRATGWLIPACSMPQIAAFGVLAGIVIYAFSWLCGIARSNKYDFGDFAAWIISGAAFGALMGVGFHFYLQIPDNPPAGNIPLVVAILDSDVSSCSYYNCHFWSRESFGTGCQRERHSVYLDQWRSFGRRANFPWSYDLRALDRARFHCAGAPTLRRRSGIRIC